MGRCCCATGASPPRVPAHRPPGYKLARLRDLLDFYEPLNFLLIGDSGQQDPQIYAQITAVYGARIIAVLLRAVDLSEERVAEVAALSAALAAGGRILRAGVDSAALAQAAADLGLIDAAAL